jgi:hypothetical protein
MTAWRKLATAGRIVRTRPMSADIIGRRPESVAADERIAKASARIDASNMPLEDIGNREDCGSNVITNP